MSLPPSWDAGVSHESLFVLQAKMVKAINPKTKVFVYRNLVKALPWYTGVRTKITDPAYDGFFLKFKPGGAYGNGTYHVPQCTDSVEGHATKCSKFYHDQEQTPQPGKRLLKTMLLLMLCYLSV